MNAHTLSLYAAAEELDKDELVHMLVMAQLKVVHAALMLEDALLVASNACDKVRAKEKKKLDKVKDEKESLEQLVEAKQATIRSLSAGLEKLKGESEGEHEPRCDFCNRTHDEVMYEDNKEDAWNGETGCCKKCEDK